MIGDIVIHDDAEAGQVVIKFPSDHTPELRKRIRSVGFSPDQMLARRRMEMESYHDAANFADLVRCPILVCCGIINPVSSATGIFTLYNRLKSPKKKILSMPVQGHDCSLSVDAYAWRRLDEALGIR